MTLPLPIRIGLVGLGRHGMRYAQHLLHDVPHARLVAVARRQVNLALPFTAPHDVARYDDPIRMIDDTGVDAVVVVTPPALNPSLCLAAAAAGKPMLVEKPMAATAADAQTMVEAVTTASLPFMVAQTLRFNPAIRAFRAAWSRMGMVSELTLTLAVPPRPRPPANPGFLGRGALLDLGVHVFDLAQWLLGRRFRSLRCIPAPIEPDEVETGGQVHMLAEGGCRCRLDIRWAGTSPVGRGEARGERGRLAVDWMAHEVEWLGSGAAPRVETVAASPTIVETLRAFVEALTTGSRMPISVQEGYEAVRLVDAAYDSARTGAPVALCRPDGA